MPDPDPSSSADRRQELGTFLLQLLENFELEMGDSFQILFLHPDLLIVDRLPGWDPPVPVNLARATLRGTLEGFSIADVIGLINMNKKSGILSFVFHGSTKALFFTKGEIVFATSSLPQDRLGESLVRAGKLKREDLEGALRDADRRQGWVLGKLLVEKAYLAPKDLFQGVRRQVEEIIYSLFLQKQGVYFFFEGDLDTRDFPKLNMSAQNLVMEGIRRIDEWGLFLEKIPSGELMLSRKRELPQIDLTPDERGVLDLADGTRTVSEISRSSGLGEFNTYKVLHHLMSAGFIDYAAPEAKEPPP